MCPRHLGSRCNLHLWWCGWDYDIFLGFVLCRPRRCRWYICINHGGRFSNWWKKTYPYLRCADHLHLVLFLRLGICVPFCWWMTGSNSLLIWGDCTVGGTLVAYRCLCRGQTWTREISAHGSRRSRRIGRGLSRMCWLGAHKCIGQLVGWLIYHSRFLG